MLKRFILTLIVAVTLFLLPAHDYWFEARPFILQPGDSLYLHLLVGDELVPSLERAFEKKPLLSFIQAHNDRIQDLSKEFSEGSVPFGALTLSDPGLYLFSMERDFSYISLTRPEFMEYLKHEEIADQQELLSWLSQRETQRERYARSVKTLVSVKGKAKEAGVYRNILNHDYEIVLENNPYLLHPGDTVTAIVLKRGKPAAGMKVMAQNKTKDFVELVEQSTSTGEVTFKLPVTGEWVIRSLWLRPCNNCDTINWESHWASFSFYLQK